jgi:hypothetical protein
MIALSVVTGAVCTVVVEGMPCLDQVRLSLVQLGPEPAEGAAPVEGPREP